MDISWFFCYSDFTWNQFWRIYKFQSCLFAIIGPLNFVNFINSGLQNVQKILKSNIRASKMADFALLESLKIDFTKNLSDRKIMKFPHCATLWKNDKKSKFFGFSRVRTHDLRITTYLAATVLRSSSLTARLISALWRSIEMFKTLLKSLITFRRSFVNSPCARKALTNEEYASNSEKEKKNDIFYVKSISKTAIFEIFRGSENWDFHP